MMIRNRIIAAMFSFRIRPLQASLFLCLAAFLPVCLCGCESAGPNATQPTDVFNTHTSAYAPAELHIIPLTKFISPDPEQYPQLKIYVDLLDAFDSQIKAPGVFRFELYEYLPRSAQPKRKRLLIWPDIDLADPDTNNKYWQDFLRSYEFVLNLDFQPAKNSKFVLQVSCRSLTIKRLTADFVLQYE